MNVNTPAKRPRGRPRKTESTSRPQSSQEVSGQQNKGTPVTTTPVISEQQEKHNENKASGKRKNANLDKIKQVAVHHIVQEADLPTVSSKVHPSPEPRISSRLAAKRAEGKNRAWQNIIKSIKKRSFEEDNESEGDNNAVDRAESSSDVAELTEGNPLKRKKRGPGRPRKHQDETANTVHRLVTERNFQTETIRTMMDLLDETNQQADDTDVFTSTASIVSKSLLASLPTNAQAELLQDIANTTGAIFSIHNEQVIVFGKWSAVTQARQRFSSVVQDHDDIQLKDTAQLLLPKDVDPAKSPHPIEGAALPEVVTMISKDQPHTEIIKIQEETMVEDDNEGKDPVNDEQESRMRSLKHTRYSTRCAYIANPEKVDSTCDLCGFKSTYQGVLKHKLRHHNNLIHMCEICGKEFGLRYDMRRHRLSHFNVDGKLTATAIKLWKKKYPDQGEPTFTVKDVERNWVDPKLEGGTLEAETDCGVTESGREENTLRGTSSAEGTLVKVSETTASGVIVEEVATREASATQSVVTEADNDKDADNTAINTASQESHLSESTSVETVLTEPTETESAASETNPTSLDGRTADSNVNAKSEGSVEEKDDKIEDDGDEDHSKEKTSHLDHHSEDSSQNPKKSCGTSDQDSVSNQECIENVGTPTGRKGVCEQCGFISTPAGVRKHRQRQHAAYRYNCLLCNKEPRQFAIYGDYVRHWKTHQPMKRGRPKAKDITVYCVKCEFVGSEAEVRRHIKSDHADSAIKCLFCDYMTYGIENIQRHFKSDHRDRLGYKPLVSRYYMLPKDGEMFFCDECQQLVFVSHYKVHMRMHESKTQSCNFCDFVAKDRKVMKKHVQKQHKDMARVFVCDMCGQRFTQESSLRFHKKTRHGIGAQPLECFHCHKVFSDIRFLNTHIKRIHLREKRYFCDICGKGFFEKIRMKEHKETIHCTGEEREQRKQWTCTYCGRRFMRKGQMQQHENVHTGNKPYICKICNRAFTWAAELNKHKASHTEAKPFICSQCGKSFKFRYKLASHMITHTKQGRNMCQDCGKVFTANATLRRHHCKAAQQVFIKVESQGGPSSEISNPKVQDQDANMESAMEDQENQEEMVSYMCGVCQALFETPEAVNEHITEQHRGITIVMDRDPEVPETTGNIEIDESPQLIEEEAVQDMEYITSEGEVHPQILVQETNDGLIQVLSVNEKENISQDIEISQENLQIIHGGNITIMEDGTHAIIEMKDQDNVQTELEGEVERDVQVTEEMEAIANALTDLAQ